MINWSNHTPPQGFKLDEWGIASDMAYYLREINILSVCFHLFFEHDFPDI